LLLGTRGGRVKRAEHAVIETMPDGVWSEVIGLEAGDGVLFAGTCGKDGEVLFFSDKRVLRIRADAVSTQQTPSARGVIGIKLSKDDRVLGGAVLRETQSQMVFVLSERGYIKRVPLEEFPVQGRGSMGVISLNSTTTTGPVVAVTAGRPTRSMTVDLLNGEDGRQRLSLRSIPIENRQNRGKKAARLNAATKIVLLD
jgi:DNA gyrase subunit A